MELLHLDVPSTKNRFVEKYINGDTSFFHYSFRSKQDDFKRYQEIMGRKFQREALSNHIRRYMQTFSPTLAPEIEHSLQKLAQENSVVVIGGQQAGLLTGPLYTIHKIVSIILLARQKEKELGVPVVPVFWIAGEDHDLHEVNHIFHLDNGKLKKNVYRQKITYEKQMISKQKLDHDSLRSWVRSVMQAFGETNFTNDVLMFLDEKVETSTTYTEFFASIIQDLFQQYGLLIVDSAHPELRQLEKEYFKILIENSLQITDALYRQQQILKEKGYEKTIDSKEDSLQLFYEHVGNRLLLHVDRKENVIKADHLTFTVQELLDIAEKNPEKLSNNVVTRPIMQEWLFPTLAFIAGPGEITYWAELKGCFEKVGLKMPPVVPRLNITFLERNIESDIEELSLSLEEILMNGTSEERSRKINCLKDQAFEVMVSEKRKEIEKIYREITDQVIQIDKGLVDVVKKNSQFVLSQLDYLQRKVEQSILMKHEVLLNKYLRIEQFLYPFNGLQERCWNIFYFINRYGFALIDQLVSLPFTFSGKHYVVKL